MNNCTRGFPKLNISNSEHPSRNVHTPMTRIIPGMNITCSGQLLGWKVAGRFTDIIESDGYSKLKILREIDNQFIFVHETELGRCAGQVPMLSDGIYSCVLPEQDRLLVQEHDIIGIYLPQLSQTRFEINFTTSPTDQINYIYSEDVTGSVNISGTGMAKNTPQLNLDIAANVPTPTHTTTATSSTSTSYSTTSTIDTTTSGKVPPHGHVTTVIIVSVILPILIIIMIIAICLALVTYNRFFRRRTKPGNLDEKSPVLRNPIDFNVDEFSDTIST